MEKLKEPIAPLPEPLEGEAEDAEAEDPSHQGDPEVNRVTLDRRAGLYNRATHRSARHRHGSSRESKLKRRLLVARVAALVSTLAAITLALLFIRSQSQLGSYHMESGSLASELSRSQTELQQAKQLVAAQEVELSALVKQRIPGVSPMEIDKLYDVEDGYFKKLSFSESGVGADKRLNYYAVLKNARNEPVRPNATILLFDRKGLQTGMARIKREAASPPTQAEDLKPGETRTFTAQLEMTRAEPPRYFLVETP